MNETEQFLHDLENDQQSQGVDVLEQPLVPTGATGGTSPEEEDDDQGATGTTEDVDDDDDENFKPKNRRERRLLRKLQAERESSIYLSGRLEARSEAERALTTEESDYLKGIERIYGTDSPESQLATDLLKKAITGMGKDAEERAYQRMVAERQQELAEEQEAQAELDGFLEDIEDTYDVSLSDAQQRGFFQLLQKMSPKDRQGNVIDYADPHAVWEIFQERMQKKPTQNRAKTLASRSMTQSGATKESTLKDDATARFLRENSII